MEFVVELGELDVRLTEEQGGESVSVSVIVVTLLKLFTQS